LLRFRGDWSFWFRVWLGWSYWLDGLWLRSWDRFGLCFWLWFRGRNRHFRLYNRNFLWGFWLLWHSRVFIRKFWDIVWVKSWIRSDRIVEIANDTGVKVYLEDHLTNRVCHPT
jgi:hypothetical protein